MLRYDDDPRMAGPWSFVKKVATGAGSGIKRGVQATGSGIKRGTKKGIKFAYKGGKLAFKLHLKAFLKLNKLALKGMCAMPGPLRAAAVGAAITAATGGAGGAAAPLVSQAAADAICKAMRTGSAADTLAAERRLKSDGIVFEPSWWEKLLDGLGLRG